MTPEINLETEFSKVKYFYIDESFIEIEDKIHTIVCAITPDNLFKASMKMVKVKKSLGLTPLDEVKMNHSGLIQELKIKLTDGVLDIMYYCNALISIIEGDDKQKASEMITSQIIDYCNQNNVIAYSLYFDKDLVPKPPEFKQFVQAQISNGAECIGIQHFNSTTNQLIRSL